MANVVCELRCPEGFSYAGYQRCEMWMVDSKMPEFQYNVSRAVAELCNGWVHALGNPDPSLLLGVCNDCFFVLSGESFSLADCAVMFEDILGLPIECVDGSPPEALIIEETIVKVNGEKFRCRGKDNTCGNTVFGIRTDKRYECTKCGQTYEGSSSFEPPTEQG